MEPTKATVRDSKDEDLIHQIRKASYIHLGHTDILAVEELIRRYTNANTGPAPEQRVSQDTSNR